MTMKTRPVTILCLIAAIAVSVLLAGCAAGDGDATGGTHKAIIPLDKTPPASETATAKNEVRIEIQDFVFKPAEITIPPGTKVTWINKDEAPHTATSVDKKFNSGGLDTDDEFSFVFNDKGEYPYFCALHPHMKATITVK